jgi:glutamate decarboxylase
MLQQLSVAPRGPKGTHRGPELPSHGLPAEETAPETAASWLEEQLADEPDPEANIGTFATTRMDVAVEPLLLEALRRNLADRGAYPVLDEFEHRCLHILADLTHCPAERGAGTSTAGSSEALYLALAAHRANWRLRGGIGRPNVVAGQAGHTCLQKFATFFDVDLRIAPSRPDLHTDLTALASLIDQRTCAIVAVAGSAQLGRLDDLEAIDAVASRTGVAVHVDAATGGFVLPFSQRWRRWDFRLPAVRSINVSGHKYGLAYPGIAWLLFRDAADVSDEFVHETSYLAGGPVRDFSLNFTRNGASVTAQYYAFMRYGRAGYERAIKHALMLASRLRAGLTSAGFIVLSDPGLQVREFSERLRADGWIDASYRVTGTDLEVLRIVVRPSMQRSTIDRLLELLSHELAAGTRRSAPTMKA